MTESEFQFELEEARREAFRNGRRFGMLAGSIGTALLIALSAHADHALWPLVTERQLEEGTAKACVFHRVERCAGLREPLPRFARTAGEPCPTDPSRQCLGNGAPFSGWYDSIHRTVILARGNNEALRHEFLHYLLHVAKGDPDFAHLGPEWVCQ